MSPWTTEDVDKHHKGLTDKEKKQWVAVANSALKRCEDEGKTGCDASAIKQANAVVDKSSESDDESETNLEELTKKEGDKSYPASDYLVVEDPKKPTTWHLRVRNNGKVSHGLMGGAWAALTSPGGHRGNKYDGPNKGDALRKLKALYKSEKMPVPGAPAVKECVEEVDLEILDCLIGECDEYVGLALEEDDIVTTAEPQVQESDSKLAETFDGMPDILEEADAMAGDVLKMRVQIIKPGWGNSKDNHYYPIEVLARDSGVFKGIKMYETDHREAEKSTRTWVSTITDIDGFTETGAPIARVAVHDPQFAQRIRNLKAANLLDKMDCSILATGKVKSGEVDGKKGNIVEAITSANSVDWVTKAGAGGHALDLVESITGSETVTVSNETTTITSPVAETVTIVTDTVTITPETEPTAEGIVEVIKEVFKEGTLEVARVPQDRVDEILAASHLPDRARMHLCNRVYDTEVVLTEVISEELTYLQEITKAGKPFGIGGHSLQENALGVSVEQANKKLSSVVNKYL